MSTMLTLDGEPIVMRAMRINLSMQFQDKDLSGQTSATSSSEQGSKAKELEVSGLVPFKDEKVLARLFELADAKQNGGQRAIYRVGSLLAQAVKVRQAKFAGRIAATEQEGVQAWQVAFTLREYNSVPEQREQRLPTGAADTGNGTPGTTAAADTGEGPLSTFEKGLKWVDEGLGGVMA